MEFLEGGIYRPIRVLFDTPIYDRALQLCWTIRSYKSQIALLKELLRLQQKNQIPSMVTAEDMIELILEESKNTLREQLWEFEMEDFDEEDAKPLLMLVWAVNVTNKMRDVECEARLLLNSPEALPPNFQHPRILSIAKNYAKILTKKQKEAPSFKLLGPKEVVLEVVPRVLQGFWVLPPRLLLNMPSQRLSKMSVGVTKAVLDRVSSALASLEHQATFSRSIRDDMVLSVLTKIRQTHPHDILVSRIKSFAPVLLREIADVTAGQIIGTFQPQSPKVPAHLTPAVEPPAITPVQDGLNLAVTEELPTPSPETNSAVVSPPSHSPTPPPEPPYLTDAEARGDEYEETNVRINPSTTREADPAAVPASLPPLPEPPYLTDAEARGDECEETNLKIDPATIREADPTAVPASLPPPPEPPYLTDAEARGDEHHKTDLKIDPALTREADPAAFPASLPPPPEPLYLTDAEARGDEHAEQNSREPGSALIPSSAPLIPPLEPVVIVYPEVEETRGFFRRLFRSLCCCFVASDTDTN